MTGIGPIYVYIFMSIIYMSSGETITTVSTLANIVWEIFDLNFFDY